MSTHDDPPAMITACGLHAVTIGSEKLVATGEALLPVVGDHTDV